MPAARTTRRPRPARTAALCAAAGALASAPRAAHAQQADPARAETSPPSQPAAPALEPPAVLTRAQPVYPADGDGHRVEVELLVTIDATGAVAEVEVLGHIPTRAPASFDAAAVAAARATRFRPARRDGQPIAVRVRYHMAVVPPLVVVADRTGPGTGPPEIGEIDDDDDPPARRANGPSVAARPAPARPAPAPAPAGVTVRTGETRNRTATEYPIALGALAQVPRTAGTDLLTLAPGVFLSNEASEGDAPEVFLRGFAGEQGQDIAFSLAGVPLNDESNPRAHGYADVYFVIPELVDRLHVTEGVADPRQGNFARAGSIDYHLALRQRGLTLRGSYGTFGFGRVVGLYGPANTNDQTFVGVDLVHSDGFGPARGFDRASGLGQYAFDLGGGASVRVLLGLYTTRWTAPGPLRQDDLDAGTVGFFGTAPNAGFQGGSSTRGLLSAALTLHRDALERAEIHAFAQVRDVTAQQNYTGYYDNEDAGDLESTRYAGAMVGARGFYHRTVMLGGRAHEGELGWFLRHDRFNVVEQALDARRGTPLAMPDDDDTNTDVRVTNVGAYLDVVTRPFAWLALRGAARFDLLAYDVDGTAFNEESGQFERAARTALGARLGPKATVEATLGAGFVAIASFGSGFRSPDAREVPAGGRLAFARVTSEELGVRWALPNGRGNGPRVTASLAAFHTEVDNDAIFDPGEGDDAPVGPTRRIGGVLWVRTQPLAWLDLNASATYTHAIAERAGGLDGLLEAGAPLPYVPSLVARLDAAAHRQVATWRGMPVQLRAGLGAGLRGPRPLLLRGEVSPTVLLLDASVGVRVGPVSFDLNGRNLLDARWRESEFEYRSNFNPGTPASPDPVRHFTAGAPLGVFGTLALHL